MTATRVNIEADAWTDLRFAALARLLNLPGGHDHALILCAKIWSWQTANYTPEQPTYVIDQAIADGVLGAGGAAAMVTARLAEETPEGLRIRGAEGRIEWLYRLADNGRKRRGKHKEVAPAPADAPQHVAQTVDPLSSLVPEEEDPPPARDARVYTRKEPSSAIPEPLGRYLPGVTPEPARGSGLRDGETQEAARDRRRALTRELWRELGAVRSEIADELGVEARPLPVMGDLGERALAARLTAADGAGQLEQAVADARHVIAVAAAEARASTPPSVQWLTGALFEDRSWRRALGMTVLDAARPRAGPRSAERAASSEPTRRVRTL